mmetsp:Transcript_10257/g.16175  ORF Transcript_10257/g.16175 Transcript_10257/m.16175 type:complete len:137 (+) Transcript_10257:379-789(+)
MFLQTPKTSLRTTPPRRIMVVHREARALRASGDPPTTAAMAAARTITLAPVALAAGAQFTGARRKSRNLRDTMVEALYPVQDTEEETRGPVPFMGAGVLRDLRMEITERRDLAMETMEDTEVGEGPMEVEEVQATT